MNAQRPPHSAGLLTTAELARTLRITPETVRKWSRTGRIPAMRCSPKALRFDMDAVLAALKTGDRREEAIRG